MREYIEREAALKAVCQACSDDCNSPCIYYLQVAELHAADVTEVRHGQWNGGATGWECSVCTIESNNTYPHCPYCGAVMDGGQDE